MMIKGNWMKDRIGLCNDIKTRCVCFFFLWISMSVEQNSSGKPDECVWGSGDHHLKTSCITVTASVRLTYLESQEGNVQYYV